MDTHPRFLQDCYPEGPSKDQVAHLLDKEIGSWDVDKVRCSFLPHEAEVILGISINSRFLDDSLIWMWTTNGRFLVKSAYKVSQKWLKKRSHKADGGGAFDNLCM